MNNDLDLLLAEIDLLKSQIELQQHHLDGALNRMLDIESSWQNNKLEGGNLTLGQTEILILNGLMPPDIPMVESLATLNFFEALQFIREQASDQALLSMGLLMETHAILARGIDRQGAGRFRNSTHTNSADTPDLSTNELPALLVDTLHDLRLNGPFKHPLVFAAETHFRLLTLQPFGSFNGACARQAMNLVLLTEGYPLLTIPGVLQSRPHYFETLEITRHGGDKSAWLQYIGEQVRSGLQSLIARLDALSEH